MLEDGSNLHRLFVVGKALAPAAFLPLLNRGPGRPPTELTREGVLKLERRRAIFALVQERPGVSVLEIARDLDMSPGSLDDHLDLMAQVGLIEKRHSGHFVRIYPEGKAPPPGDPMLLPESTRVVARLILAQPRTSAELAEELGFAVQVVRRHVRALLDAGLVAEDMLGGRRRRYVPTERLAEAAAAWQRGK